MSEVLGKLMDTNAENRALRDQLEALRGDKGALEERVKQLADAVTKVRGWWLG
jgi:predicted nuclease with TOPRIM domain